MLVRQFGLAAFVAAGLTLSLVAYGQEPAPTLQAPQVAEAPPDVPKGVEVMTRGPVHEAFASLTAEPQATQPVPKKPPKALEEMPPDEKPEGNVVWISGYWAWDDDRKDFLWVSGIWRTPPPGRHWVAGYWREESGQSQWVPGFWDAKAQNAETHQVTYMPQPPQPPQVADPGKPPTEESFWVPGYWMWNGETYAWKAGYWARVQPGYVWVAAHYVWSPSGYVFVPGYWDLAVARRGVLYAPVVIDPYAVEPGFVYTPAYVVPSTVIVDDLWVRPCYHHYYFGDYYEVRYRDYGYESVVVYGRAHYEPIIVYERWDHRYEPEWERTRVNIYIGRSEGRIARPPRTLVEQRTIVHNTTIINNTTVVNNRMVVPRSQMTAATGVKTVPVDTATRVQAKQQAQNIQQVGAQRQMTETRAPAGGPSKPMAASYTAPKTQSVAAGMKAEPTTAAAPKPMAPAAPARPTTPATGTTAQNQAARPGTPPNGTRPGAPNNTRPQPKPAPKPPAKDPPKGRSDGRSTGARRMSPF